MTGPLLTSEQVAKLLSVPTKEVSADVTEVDSERGGGER